MDRLTVSHVVALQSVILVLPKEKQVKRQI